MAQKLCRIIMFHGELVTFNFHFTETQKVPTFMIFGPSGHLHDSQNQLFWTLGPPMLSRNTNTFICREILFREISEYRASKIMEKRI